MGRWTRAAGRRFHRFIGDPGWTAVFPKPPKQPDSRAIYLGGIGIITAARGAFSLFASQPQAWLFSHLGPGFVSLWSAVWVLIGIATVGVAATGHRHPDWDRLVAFVLLALWWGWGILYLVSAVVVPAEIADERRLNDLLQAVILFVTGTVLAAGVAQNLRKTQEILLRQLAVSQLKEREADLLVVVGENERLRRELEERGPRA